MLKSSLCTLTLSTLALATVAPRAAIGQSGPQVTAEIVAKAAAAKTPLAPGPVQPNWESIRENYTVPQWYIDAKFGITMHWGLFSVPAYHNEWYEKYMYTTFSDWHTQNFGPPDKFGYKDFIPLFTAKAFNADDMAALVKDSGAKYFAPTVEHHDGFSLWNSATNPWNAYNMGPHRDLVGEMATATRKAGLKFGVASHNIEHYTFVNKDPGAYVPKPGLKSDTTDPKYQDFYWTEHNDKRLQKFLEDWVAKNDELIDQYQPDLIWYDNGLNGRQFDPLKTKVAAYYFNRAREWHKEVTFQTKGTAFLAGSVLEFEKLNPRGPTQILNGIWDAEESIGSTWGYSAQNPVETFRSPYSVINLLCTILSMNGGLLLNLSPDGQGAINAPQRNTLHEVGKWLAINGEAVYGSHAWIKDGEGFVPLKPHGADSRTAAATAAAALEQGATAKVDDVAAPTAPAAKAVVYRFTAKGDALYAIAQSWPGETALIASLATGKTPEGKIASVTMLGNTGDLKFTQDAQGLHVTLPATKPCDYAYTLKITGLKMNPAGPPVPAVMADLR
jgi:alpha-L-fucosidase